MAADHMMVTTLIPLNGRENLTPEQIAQEIIENDSLLMLADKIDRAELESREVAEAHGRHIGLAFHRAVVAGRG